MNTNLLSIVWLKKMHNLIDNYKMLELKPKITSNRPNCFTSKNYKKLII